MTSWHVAEACVRGASHEDAGTPNEDSVASWAGDGEPESAVVVAVADGHGTPRCFRSHIGSQLAVETAVPVLRAAFGKAGGAQASSRLPTAVVDTVARSLVDGWRARVDEHLREHPITADERSALAALPEGEAAVAEADRWPHLAYGTTLVAAAGLGDDILVVQIGDGDVLLVNDEGTVTRPLPGDSRLIGNQTTSLAGASADRDFRIKLVRPSVDRSRLVMISTDGYSNSFVDERAFEQVGEDLLLMIRDRGLAVVAGNLERWLSDVSRDGSRDDISIGVLWLADDRIQAAQTEPAVPMGTVVLRVLLTALILVNLVLAAVLLLR